MIELLKVNDNRVNGTMRDIGTDSFVCRVQYLDDLDPFMEYNVREPPRPLYHTFNTTIPLSYQIAAVHRLLQAPHRLDDATLQVFKDGDYGPYLDLDSTLGEQDEELEGLQDSRKNALVLRTQLSVRVHSIIERLLHSQGRELRRALFTLKQILQSDKDLVHEFVLNKGLDCLIQVGKMADHNYLDYILRAMGQVLLYVDGMHGVMAHDGCVPWLYTQIGCKFRHIIKTSLKLLLVFAEYTAKNCLILINAIVLVDTSNNRQTWHNLMKILQDVDASDTELLIYAMTLINRCLNNAPDKDLYYDQVDSLLDQGIDEIVQLYMSKQGIDLDLLRQLQIFDAVLLYEDNDDTAALKQLDDSVINSIRRRASLSTERRRSKKHRDKAKPVITHAEPEIKITNNHRQQFLPSITDNKENKELSTALRRRRDRFARQAHHIIQQQEMLNHSSDIYNGLFGSSNGTYTGTNGSFTSSNGSFTGTNGILPGTNGNYTGTNGSFTSSHRTFSTPNESFSSMNGSFTSQSDSFSSLNGSFKTANGSFASTNGNYTGTNGTYSSTNGNYTNMNGSYTNGTYANNKSYSSVNGSLNGMSNCNGVNNHQDEDDSYINRTTKNFNLAEVLKNGNQRYTSGLKQRIQNGTLGHSVSAADAIAAMRQKQLDTPEVKDDRGILLNREHSIKDLAQRLTSPVSPTTEDKPIRVADMAGIVSKAKEELAKSQSKEIIKSPSIEKSPKVHEIKVSENDLHWEELRKGCLHREFQLCDLDFSDLKEDSDDDMMSPAVNAASGPPPPPPTMFPPMGIPPPLPGCFPPPPKNNVPIPPKALSSELSNDSDSSTIKKNKKTVKLFWREIQENPTPMPIRPKIGGFIWDDLPTVNVDTHMLEHLFESRTNDLIIKEKLSEPKRNLILDAKRSNAINIAMKKLPTPQTIKAAIMKMDATVIGREGIEKLLTMLPTEEEKVKIQEAQYANPDLPLGSAEQFLLTLASINELSSRLKLWVFKLDFDNLEKEIAEPLMDLKQGIELLKVNRTFKVILSTLRTVGNYLNGNYAKGFRLEYLSKVVEVKDTVHKHPLLYHVCEMIIEKFPDSSDFFSEVGPVIRASKVDFDVLTANLQKLESDCKASWDHMKRVAKHDGSQIFKTKINEFLTDAAERIILLSLIRKRVMSRFNKFLLFLGVPPCDISKTKPAEFLKVIAEFSLEYRTTRERVLQQLEKKANHRERNKTRGKMIIDVSNYSTKNGDHTADNALKELLKTDPDTDSLTDGRRKSQSNNRRILVNGDFSADDEILESLVRSATTKRKPMARERRRNRISDRKNLNRTLDGNQS
ncbi:formin homology 2 domain containing isoform X3 [Anticarsia gemmatalis]|uniref:formin homology 2 domain containing isoform X3 n=1 Tax=Anticarsia gemmatalis TaxID=129554 RepID=UPI003F75A755